MPDQFYISEDDNAANAALDAAYVEQRRADDIADTLQRAADEAQRAAGIDAANDAFAAYAARVAVHAAQRATDIAQRAADAASARAADETADTDAKALEWAKNDRDEAAKWYATLLLRRDEAVERADQRAARRDASTVARRLLDLEWPTPDREPLG